MPSLSHNAKDSILPELLCSSASNEFHCQDHPLLIRTTTRASLLLYNYICQDTGLAALQWLVPDAKPLQDRSTVSVKMCGSVPAAPPPPLFSLRSKHPPPRPLLPFIVSSPSPSPGEDSEPAPPGRSVENLGCGNFLKWLQLVTQLKWV